MRLHKIFNVPIFLLLAFQAVAQESVTIRASVDKNKILIGEPILLTIETDIPGDALIRFVQIDSIDHFEFLENPKIDTINTNSGTRIEGRYRITSFDSGHWVIPSFVLAENLATDSIPVDVVFSPFDPTKDYHDIKDIIDVQTEEKKKPTWWYYAAGGALLVILLLIYLLRKKKPVAKASQEVLIDAYKDAMEQLDKLQREKITRKEYYSRLTDIFRLYIFRKKGIQSLQKTTDDLVEQLKGIAIPKGEFDQLSQALRLSDFVKFAKSIPDAQDDKNAFDIIKKSIQDIQQLPV